MAHRIGVVNLSSNKPLSMNDTIFSAKGRRKHEGKINRDIARKKRKLERQLVSLNDLQKKREEAAAMG